MEPMNNYLEMMVHDWRRIKTKTHLRLNVDVIQVMHVIYGRRIFADLRFGRECMSVNEWEVMREAGQG